MKKLFDKSWGQLDFDQSNKRLIMTLNNSSEEQAAQLHDEMLKAVKENQVDSLLGDIRQRTSSTDENVNYSIKSFKKAMQNGLQRVAVLRSQTDQGEQQKTNNFISGMGSDQVRYFDNKQDAESFLSGTGSQQKAA